jgi:hypothetical protein
MDLNLFFVNNKINIVVTNSSNKIELGTVSELTLNTDQKQCNNADSQAQQLKNNLKETPVSPQFTQSLLIISFMLLVAEICWLIAYYCFDGLLS